MEEKLVDLVNTFSSFAVKVAPDVLDMALLAVRADGIGCVIVGAICAIALCFALPFALRKFKEASATNYSERVPVEVQAGLASIASLGLFIGASTQLLNVWNWIAIIEPRAALMHHLLNSMGPR